MTDEDDRRSQPTEQLGLPSTLPEPNASLPVAVAEAAFGSIEIGDVVGEAYRVIGRLGEGAMGVVRLARDERLDRPVAIKLIRPERVLNAQAHELFQDEARAMAKVSHANVVTIFASGEHEGVPYFVMEYVPGMDLETWIEAQGGVPLPVDLSVSVLREICAGVTAVHAAGAVHGDLKPTNVLVSEDARIVVSDLGLARILSSADEGSHTEDLMGTPAYMAPELLSMRLPSLELAPRQDVYSLGVMAYEFLTGRLPFEGYDTVSLLNMHATMPPPPPTSVADLPSAVDDVLLNALAKDPAMRTESAALFARELEDATMSLRAANPHALFVVLDDDEDFLEFAKATLVAAFPGSDVRTFTDPTAALAVIREERCSAVVVDLEMPDTNGLEFVATVRAQPACGKIPIAVVTAVGSAKDWRVLKDLGADAFIAKPMDPDDLARAVRRMIGRSSMPPPPRSQRPGG